MTSNEQGHINLQLDDESFELLFKENFAFLCAYCQYKFDFDLDLSKEVVHTAFIKLWESRLTLSPGLPVKPYLFRVITNISLDMLKHEKVKEKHKRYIENSSAGITDSGFEGIDVKQLSAEINKAIADLPSQMQKIFLLSRFDGLKYATIAEQLDISVKTVETQMGRALARLRKALAEYLFLLFVIALQLVLRK